MRFVQSGMPAAAPLARPSSTHQAPFLFFFFSARLRSALLGHNRRRCWQADRLASNWPSRRPHRRGIRPICSRRGGPSRARVHAVALQQPQPLLAQCVLSAPGSSPSELAYRCSRAIRPPALRQGLFQAWRRWRLAPARLTACWNTLITAPVLSDAKRCHARAIPSSRKASPATRRPGPDRPPGDSFRKWLGAGFQLADQSFAFARIHVGAGAGDRPPGACAPPGRFRCPAPQSSQAKRRARRLHHGMAALQLDHSSRAQAPRASRFAGVEGALAGIGPTTMLRSSPLIQPRPSKRGRIQWFELRVDRIMLERSQTPDGFRSVPPWGLKLQVRQTQEQIN